MLIFKRLLAIPIALCALPYLAAPAYRFPDVQTFHGSALWNPYAGPVTAWQRANFHAHGRAWNGLTNGAQTDQEVVNAYRARGYSVAGISDYHHIAAHDGVDTMPIYEHGYNIGKHHQLAIGAREVDWFDFPLWQGLNQKQYVIDRLKRTADLVAIAHPMWGYAVDDIRNLSGYELLEVVNGPYIAEDLWDAALSSGHAVWILANDDSHDVTDTRRMAIAWNMVDAASSGASDVIPALRAGRMYAVSAPDGQLDALDGTLTGFELHHTTLTVSISAAADFAFIGQNGKALKVVKDTTSASYTIAPNDSYVRTVISTPNSTVYLNPVIRYDGASLSGPVATHDSAWTWVQRMVVAVTCLATMPILWKRNSA